MKGDRQRIRQYAAGIAILSLLIVLWGGLTFYMLQAVPQDPTALHLLRKLYSHAMETGLAMESASGKDVFDEVLNAHAGISEQSYDLQTKLSMVGMALGALQAMLTLAFWYEVQRAHRRERG